jgi:uncharacterized membrane protein HdeD (DUF308 family)
MTVTTRVERVLSEIIWGWWLLVLFGLLSVVAGVIILFKPGSSVADPNIGFATVAILVGVGFILNGIGMTVVGWAMRTINGATSTAG